MWYAYLSKLGLVMTVLILAMAVVHGQSDEEDDGPSDEDSFALKSVVEGTTKFAKKFYFLLRESKAYSGNLIFSPLSLTASLAMLQNGATSTRKDELKGALEMRTLSDAQIAEGFSELIQSLPESDYINYKSLERIYVPVNHQIRTKFRESLQEDFSVANAVRSMDFAKSVTSAEKINSWFSQRSKGKLTSIISPDSISKDTKLLVTSGAYFRGRWEYPFTLLPVGVTQSGTDVPIDYFYLNDTHAAANVTFMTQQGPLKYVNLPEMRAEAVAIPFSGERLEMVLLIPKNRDGLKFPLEAQLKAENRTLTSIFSQMKVRHINLALPKFETESFFTFAHTDFRSMIKKLGLNVDQSLRGLLDYNGITAYPGLYLDKIVHKVVLTLTEKGEQQAREEEPSKDFIEIRADRPFLFFVHDTETKAIFLMGRKSI